SPDRGWRRKPNGCVMGVPAASSTSRSIRSRWRVRSSGSSPCEVSIFWTDTRKSDRPCGFANSAKQLKERWLLGPTSVAALLSDWVSQETTTLVRTTEKTLRAEHPETP